MSGVRNAEARIVTEVEPRRVDLPVGIAVIGLARRVQQDLLHIAHRQIRIGRQQQRRHAGNLRRGAGGPAEPRRAKCVIGKVARQARPIESDVAAAVGRGQLARIAVAAGRADQQTGPGIAVGRGPSVLADRRNRDVVRSVGIAVVVGVAVALAVVAARTHKHHPQPAATKRRRIRDRHLLQQARLQNVHRRVAPAVVLDVDPIRFVTERLGQLHARGDGVAGGEYRKTGETRAGRHARDAGPVAALRDDQSRHRRAMRLIVDRRKSTGRIQGEIVMQIRHADVEELGMVQFHPVVAHPDNDILAAGDCPGPANVQVDAFALSGNRAILQMPLPLNAGVVVLEEIGIFRSGRVGKMTRARPPHLRPAGEDPIQLREGLRLPRGGDRIRRAQDKTVAKQRFLQLQRPPRNIGLQTRRIRQTQHDPAADLTRTPLGSFTPRLQPLRPRAGLLRDQRHFNPIAAQGGLAKLKHRRVFRRLRQARRQQRRQRGKLEQP